MNAATSIENASVATPETLAAPPLHEAISSFRYREEPPLWTIAERGRGIERCRTNFVPIRITVTDSPLRRYVTLVA
jgi:hypothetical protein